MNIFFSYTVRDGLVDRTGLGRVAKRLEQFSSPYIDLLEHRCGGHQPSVWNALSKADAFLLCITPRVFDSPWVALECAAALSRGVAIYGASPSAWLSVQNASEIERHLTVGCRGYESLSRRFGAPRPKMFGGLE
jgi:hypothetical protein